MLDSNEFPLVRPLPSTISAGQWPGFPANEPLFDGFLGTMGLSDCPVAYTLGLWSQTFPSRTELETRSVASGLSRFPRMELLHMQRVSDSVGRYATRITLRTVLSSPFEHKVDAPK